MSFKNIFAKNKLKSHFTFSQKGNIWRMNFSAGDMLVCETRDLESKNTFFASMNFRTKQVYLSNFQLEEKWWLSVETATDDLIFFNYFRTPELPEHIGITAVDIITGKTKWENKDLTFLFADSAELYAYEENLSREIFYKLDAVNGKIIEKYEDDKIADSLLELKKYNEEKLFSGFLYPEIFIHGKEDDSYTGNYFTARFDGIKYSGEIEFIDTVNLLIYNYHVIEGINLKDITKQKLSNKLEIIDKKSGKLIHEEKLNTDAVNYVPDSFFIKDGFLFYIKEKKELVIIDLNRLIL
jgi:hypothetical protein